MSTAETPDLLFFDTFSHDTSEELNLDLVQFPKSVYVREIRIIPLGARVEGDFPGGVRLGATNPTKFHIDFFVNDLSKPGASTFEALGSLDYCQNGQIHMEYGSDVDQPRIPTDGLVLKGWYTTITLAVYGNLTQVIPEPPIGVNPPAPVPRPSVAREPPPVQQPPPQNPEWTPEQANPIPAYTGNVAVPNPDVYGPPNYPDNYDTYRNDYYENDVPKDPRTYHHMEETEWEKRDISCERDPDRMRRSSRSIELERDRDRRDGRSRRLSIDRRSRESSRLRDRSREDRIDRVHSHSRSRERDYMVKGEYRPLSRSRSRSGDRMRGVSADHDWDRGSYKKDDYRRHRDVSYDRSRGGSYEKDPAYDRRSPYDKRASSYERKAPYEKRGSSYERRAPSYDKQSPFDRKQHSPYSRIRRASYGSRSPSRDDPRKRPRTPPGAGEGSLRPLSPRDREVSSPINSIRSEEAVDYDRSGKQIPRVDFYHQSYRHKSSIRSPSEEVERPPYVEPQHSTLVTVPITDNPTPKTVESPRNQDDDKSMDAEPFEPILSDEDICDDIEGPSYMEVDYEVNEYCGVDDIIKYYNPFKVEWSRYDFENKIHYLSSKKDAAKDVLSATFEELCEASSDLFKLSEMAKTVKRMEHKFAVDNFASIENPLREDWVHQCEQVFVSMTNLCKNSDIILRIFPNDQNKDSVEEFSDIYELLITFCKIGLTFDFALAQQQPTYKIRHMKCGIRLAEALTSHRYSEIVMKSLLDTGIDLPMMLLEIYSKEYMALSIRLMILKALNACLSSKLAIDHFMKEAVFPKFDKKDTDRRPKNGYQALISIMQFNPLTRIKFSLSALIKKLNMYELLGKLRELVFKLNDEEKTQETELSESDSNFIVDALDEVLYMYRVQCFHISQPKRFLPAPAQFDINKECSNEVLLEFFNIHQILQVCLCILTSPSTCNNLVVISPIHDLIYELVHSENGLKFLYRNMEMSELIFKTLIQPYGQQNSEEFIYPHDLSSYSELQILAFELAYRLRAVYHLESIGDLQAGKGDENELIDRLQALYCLSFGSIGKIAVPDVIVMGDRADCLMEVFENDLKTKGKSDTPLKQKSPAKGYAIELIVSAIRFSADVPFLKKYGPRLIGVSKEHDRFEPSVSSVLQEVIPYLKPIEKATVLAGEDMAELVEIMRASAEHAPDLPGELTTCLRILRHFCISDYDRNITIANETATEEYVELKYKYNVLQLFSLDGMAHLTGILDKLTTHFDQPSMHTSFFVATRGLQLAQLLVPCLRLADEMLARVVRCRGPGFRDVTAAPVLLRAYGLARGFPAGCVGQRWAARAAQAAVRALLAYAQPVADEAPAGEGIRRGPWTSLCAEVISYTMSSPSAFVPGLLVFSELLPLPLPLQTRGVPTPQEVSAAGAARRLWAGHLHPLGAALAELLRLVCLSTCRPLLHMLRRVCVQVADLAPNTASVVARAAADAARRQVKAGAGAGAARALGFLACLASHAPVKCALLQAPVAVPDILAAVLSHSHASPDLAPSLSTDTADQTPPSLSQPSPDPALSLSHSSPDHAAAQEFAAHTLAALCDIEITLTPNATPDLLIANSLPSKEALATCLEASADCLESTTKTCAVAQAILRAYFVLTDHEYGFQQFRKFVAKKRDALGKFFKWTLESAAEDRAECLSLYVDLIRILRAEEGEGSPAGRRAVLSPQEVADMVGYSPGEEDHPLFKLETILKERNSVEDLAAAQFIVSQASLPATEPAAEAEPPAAAPAPLAAQFLARPVHAPAHKPDDRLTASYWLNLPAVDVDEANDSELVACDILELANTHLSSCGGGAGLCAAVRRLAGCAERPPEPAVAEDKRLAVALSRGRECGAADAFRSRPPNTSRPPSLHVDTFTALHHYSHNNRGMRRGAADRGRFASQQPVHSHYRHLRGRGAWEMGASHFGHFPPAPQYMMGAGWGGARARGPRHRNFMR